MAKKKASKKKTVKPARKKLAAKTTKKPGKKKVAKKIVKKAAPKKKAPATSRAVRALGPKIGDPLPNFSAPATNNQEFQLAQHKGKKVVLYFYPKDATPGCTIEGHEFTKLLADFKSSGAEVYGVSRDDLKSHEKFKSKECFSFDLLSDEDETLCNLFDVIKEKNMYGRKVMGIERSTFLIDEEGRLVAEWRGVKVPGHAEEVLAKVRGQ